MAAIIAGQNIQKRSTSKCPTQYTATNTTATAIIHPIEIPAMAPGDKPVSVISAWPQFGSSSAKKKKIKGVSTELREQCVRGFHMRETTLVQHTALCHCVSQENVIQLKPVYSNPPLSLPPLHPSWSQLSRSSSLSRTIFASPLRVGDGGTQKLSNVVSWS